MADYILIVEDDNDINHMLSELLGSQGEKDGQGNGTGTMGRVLDVWERRIGLRTMTIRREKDAYGESFVHEVNGVTIFGMGRRLLSRRLFLRCL